MTHINYNYKICNSPFAFFTTCIMNDLFRFMKMEYDHSNAVNATRLRYGLEADYGYTEMVKDQESEEKEPNDEEGEDIEGDDSR